MKKHILYISLIIIMVTASLPLVACQKDTASIQISPSETTPPITTTETGTPSQPSAKPVAALPPDSTSPSDTATEPAEKPLETTPTVPAQSTTPTPTPDLPDLKPYLIDGKSAIIIDNSSTDYKKIVIKAGVTNAGKVTANNVIVALYRSGTKLYTWDAGQIGAGEDKILEVTIENILEQSEIYAGQHSLYVDCSLSGGGKDIGGNNKSDTSKYVIAPAPVATRQSQSTMEQKIQDAFLNATWYTNSNKDELLAIAKDVLKGAYVSWTSVTFEILPSEKFNDVYPDLYGETVAEKKQISEWLAKIKYPGICFIYGTYDHPTISLKEGTIAQLLPVIMYQMGTLNYAQKNYSAYSAGNKNNTTRLAGSLIVAYGIRVMREKYGLSGLSNMSALLNTVQYPGLTGTTSLSVNLRRMWALADKLGYPEGDVPSDKLFKEYMILTGRPDPTSYVAELDEKADLLDKDMIENIIRWRLADKELTMLPADIAQKINAGSTALSLDLIISYQEFVAFPW